MSAIMRTRLPAPRSPRHPDHPRGNAFGDYCCWDEEAMQEYADLVHVRLPPARRYSRFDGNDPEDVATIESILIGYAKATGVPGRSDSEKIHNVLEQLGRSRCDGDADASTLCKTNAWEEAPDPDEQFFLDPDFDESIGPALIDGVDLIATKLENGKTAIDKASTVPEENIGGASLINTDKLAASEPKLRPCDKRAFGQYEYAIMEESSIKTDKEAYNWLKDCNLIETEELPKYSSWVRYVRRARRRLRKSKNSPRSSHPETRSIIRQNQIR